MLRRLFLSFSGRHAAMEGETEGDLKRRFRNHVFCLLTRYAALAGGTDRGGGMQGVRQRSI